MNRSRWISLGVGLIAVVALGALVSLFSYVGLDTADKLASVISGFFGLAAFAVALRFSIRERADPDANAEATTGPPDDPLARAGNALTELRMLMPLVEAELDVRERAFEALEERAKQQEEHAQRTEARAKLFEEAADAVRDLVAETYKDETDGLRQQLAKMERKNRRDQVVFALIGACAGVATNLFIGG